MLKAIIVEDELASRTTLNNYISKYCPGVEVLDMCESIKIAKRSIATHKPDLVFLDIEMPYGNAFDLLESIANIDFEVIFVTAYKDYAIKALNLSAAYYILKPINIDELIHAVEKIIERKKDEDVILHSKVLMDNIRSNNVMHKKIVLPQMDGFEVISISEIIRAEADNNYTIIYLLNGERRLISKTLKHFDDLLSEYNFIRTHKSHLINLTYVKKYIKGKVGQVVMSDDSVVEVSSVRKKAFFRNFK